MSIIPEQEAASAAVASEAHQSPPVRLMRPSLLWSKAMSAAPVASKSVQPQGLSSSPLLQHQRCVRQPELFHLALGPVQSDPRDSVPRSCPSKLPARPRASQTPPPPPDSSPGNDPRSLRSPESVEGASPNPCLARCTAQAQHACRTQSSARLEEAALELRTLEDQATVESLDPPGTTASPKDTPAGPDSASPPCSEEGTQPPSPPTCPSEPAVQNHGFTSLFVENRMKGKQRMVESYHNPSQVVQPESESHQLPALLLGSPVGPTPRKPARKQPGIHTSVLRREHPENLVGPKLQFRSNQNQRHQFKSESSRNQIKSKR